MVRLKERDLINLIKSSSYFNSTMVRLKEQILHHQQQYNPYFNSTMVRLKVIGVIFPIKVKK